MRLKFSHFNFVVFCVFINQLLFAQHKYYFSSQTTGEGIGTRQQPFKSLEKLAGIVLRKGDTVFFHADETFNGNISLSNINGVKQHEIIFTTYGKGKSTINGGNKEAVTITGSSFLTIINLRFVGAGRKTGNTANGLG